MQVETGIIYILIIYLFYYIFIFYIKKKKTEKAYITYHISLSSTCKLLSLKIEKFLKDFHVTQHHLVECQWKSR